MPFIGPSEDDASRWSRITTVDLRQLPVTGRWKVYFEVIGEFGYTDLPPDSGGPSRPEWSAQAVQHLVPREMKTDLASVPSFLWGVVASYGRQTLPALLHDMLCYAAAQPDQPAAYRRRARRQADDLFRTTLRASGSGFVRRWLMWTAVRLFGRKSVAACFALLVLAGLVELAPGFTWQPVRYAIVVAGAALLMACAFAAVERDRRPVGGERTGQPVPASEEYTAARFNLRAFGSVLWAVVIGLVLGPPIILIGVVTLVTELLVGLGERSVASETAAPSRGTPGGDAPGAMARITWSPLVEPQDSTVNANPGRSDL